VGDFCLYVKDILLTSHTHDDAHGLVPTRLIGELVTLLHITFEAHCEDGLNLICLMS
jgi:hypothetical protein